MGRMVYSSEKGNYLKVHPKFTFWMACDDKECSNLSSFLVSGGGANGMNPAAKEAESSKSRWPDKKSWWKFGDLSNIGWVNLNITLTCRETISKKSLLKDFLKKSVPNKDGKERVGIILSTTGVAAEYHGPLFGLYRRDVINGSPSYSQLGSGPHEIDKWTSDNVWYVSHNKTLNLRNRNASADLPTSGWEFSKNDEWVFDPHIKVEHINENDGDEDDEDEDGICSSVIVDGDAGIRSEYLGRFDAVNGTYSAGRLIYKNKKLGKLLKVRNDFYEWTICDLCDNIGCSEENLECSSVGLLSGGGANSMNPTDPVAATSRDRDVERKSWGFAQDEKINNNFIKVNCLD